MMSQVLQRRRIGGFVGALTGVMIALSGAWLGAAGLIAGVASGAVVGWTIARGTP